jgi:hypothetical protein
MNRRAGFPLSTLLFLVSACASTPTATSPDWIRSPSRSVDAGYILFVGTGEDPAPEKSTFKAESQALQDLANECSFAPKGTRIEDHYQEKSGHTILTYAKVAISFIDCDAAKAANDPDSIKKLASAPLAEQLKRYQDLVYAPAEPESENSTRGPAPIADEDHFFIVRQRVAYVKETIILSPTSVYPANAPQTIAATNQLGTQSDHLRVYEQANPAVKTSHRGWTDFEKNTTAELPRSIPHLQRNSAPAAPVKHDHLGKHYGGKKPEAAAPPAPAPKKKHRRKHGI